MQIGCSACRLVSSCSAAVTLSKNAYLHLIISAFSTTGLFPHGATHTSDRDIEAMSPSLAPQKQVHRIAEGSDVMCAPFEFEQNKPGSQGNISVHTHTHTLHSLRWLRQVWHLGRTLYMES